MAGRNTGYEARKAKALKQERNRKISLVASIAVPVAAALVLCGFILHDGALGAKIGSSGVDGELSDIDYTNVYDEAGETVDTPSQVLSSDSALSVQIGDTVFIDYVGTVGGEEFDGGSTGGMGTDLTIGSGMYIDGFEDQLVGSHPGDEVEVRVTFPEDYGVEGLDGMDAVFTVQVHGIYQYVGDALADPGMLTGQEE